MFDQKYIDYALEKELNQVKFLKNLRYYNTAQFLYTDLSYSLREKVQKDYVFLKSITNYFISLNYENAFFITFTLPSNYHTDVDDLKIENGYKLLNSSFRDLQKTLSAYKVKYKYIRVVEPHKSLVPHFHILLFFSGKSYAFVRNLIYRIKRKHLLGRSQVKLIDNPKNVVKYITKYISKTVSNNLEELYFIRGWVTYHRFRQFTYSNVPLPKYIFKKLLCCLTEDEKKKSLEDYGDYYLYLLDNVNIFRSTDEKYFTLTKKKYNVCVVYDTKSVFRYRAFKYVYYDMLKEYYESGNSVIEDIFLEYSLDPYDYVVEKFDTKIILFDKFYNDYIDCCIEVEKYVYVKDIIIYRDDELVFKKTLNFIEKISN